MTRHGYREISQDDEKTPQKVGFVSYVLFLWMNSVFRTGQNQVLEQSDFLPLSKENSTSFLTQNLQENWRKEERKCHETPRGRPKLWKSVIRTISFRELMILICMGIFRSFFRIPLPLLLGYLIASLMSSEPQQKMFLYGCALALFISALMERVTAQMIMYRCELLGITMSSALKGLVYHKVGILTYRKCRACNNLVEKQRSQSNNCFNKNAHNCWCIPLYLMYNSIPTSFHLHWFNNDRKTKVTFAPNNNMIYNFMPVDEYKIMSAV